MVPEQVYVARAADHIILDRISEAEVCGAPRIPLSREFPVNLGMLLEASVLDAVFPERLGIRHQASNVLADLGHPVSARLGNGAARIEHVRLVSGHDRVDGFRDLAESR